MYIRSKGQNLGQIFKKGLVKREKNGRVLSDVMESNKLQKSDDKNRMTYGKKSYDKKTDKWNPSLTCIC